MTERHWPWLGAGLGSLTGLFDYSLFSLLDVRMMAGDREVTPLIALFYGLSFAVGGWLVGRVAAQRVQIRRQLTAVAEARAQAAQSEKLATVGRLAAGVAHEVRNPLAVIKSSAALLAESVPPDDAGLATAATFIQEEVDRLDAFISALLDYSRPRPPTVQEAPAGRVLQRFEALARGDAESRGVALSLADESRGAQAPLDVDQLSQALFALVVNAGQAVGAGGRVEVRALPGPAFEVLDDGPGVPPADAERIFEPFFTTKARGTGLGLAMAARIAEAHGGRLSLRAGGGLGPGGRGACFHLALGRLP
ncbi:MAG: ATP-binding protein [bacterium]